MPLHIRDGMSIPKTLPSPVGRIRKMSVVNNSDYSITVKNSSSALFTLFHAAVDHNSKATADPSKGSELAPGGETCLAWNSPAGQISAETSRGHIYYSPSPAPGSTLPRVWGVELQGYTPGGDLPKTLYQYTAALNPEAEAKIEPGPSYWIEAGKDWRESYSFIVSAESRTGKVKITVANDPHDKLYKETGKPLYSVVVLVEDY
ncbi:hypothetical protein B0H11DRAFT_2012407 [Mycena galericulata]|nr:hypothetical protein B0H11DRAFT_2012407 [Mycena galericulata]